MAKKVLNEVVANYDFKQEVTTPVEELLGIETQMPTAAIMNLDEMGRFIDSHKNSVLFKINLSSFVIYYVIDQSSTSHRYASPFMGP